jgi:alpha-beta hydrolase superfamily lysophospholipase
MSDIDLNTASNKKVNTDFTPVIHEEWWRDNITYSTINRQGIDICTASFVHPNPKGNIIFITGWSETFLKYPEMIKTFYESGYSVYTYDHQSQGLSGRWLPEHQSTWIKSFDDYVDDFIYFVGMIGKNDSNHLSLYCVAHSMGGLVVALAIIKHPSLIKKVVFSAPMFRNKCGMKALEYKFPLPQPLTYWITNLVCTLGLGKQLALGMFKEDPQAHITLKLTKDKEQLKNWEVLRRKYPRIIASCVTNDWVLQSLIAQEKFSSQYVNFKPKCLVFKATEDIFVYNHAMDQFAKQAPNARLFTFL